MTTDTTPLAPTDAEIIALMGDPRYSTIGAVREAISRWGQLYTTPQPAQAQAEPKSGAKSFQTYGEANAYSKGYYAGKKAAKQPQGGAVPLTDEQIHAIYDEVARREPYAGAVTRRSIVRAIEAAHGIKGGQHGTDT